MIARLAVDASEQDRIGGSWNDVTSPSLRLLGQARNITLKIHKKSSFQQKKEIFAKSCSVRYKDSFLKSFFNKQQFFINWLWYGIISGIHIPQAFALRKKRNGLIPQQRETWSKSNTWYLMYIYLDAELLQRSCQVSQNLTLYIP